jgi:hypothetical protein
MALTEQRETLKMTKTVRMFCYLHQFKSIHKVPFKSARMRELYKFFEHGFMSENGENLTIFLRNDEDNETIVTII